MGSVEEVGGSAAIDLLGIPGATNPLPVASLLTAYSQAIVAPRNASFGLEIKLAGSTADVKVELEHSNSAPGTEEEADTNFVTGESISDLITNLTDKLKHFVAVSPVVCKYIRFKFTGQGSNSADITVSVLKFNYSKNA